MKGPRAWVKRSPKHERGRWNTWREKPNGELGFVTYHWRRSRAERAKELYEQFGLAVGRLA